MSEQPNVTTSPHGSYPQKAAQRIADLEAENKRLRNDTLDAAVAVIQECREAGETDHRSMIAGIRALKEGE